MGDTTNSKIADWQWGEGYYDNILGKRLDACLTASLIAHNDPERYDEYFKCVRLFALAVIPLCGKGAEDQYFKEEENVLKELSMDKTYIFSLNLKDNKSTRAKVDTALFKLLWWLNKTAYENNLIIKTAANKSHLADVAREEW